ncbi:hypothetical protein GW17_00054554 [Ensete ventricosum]|nr:hypothetical protein GW17_00054554 [Ensete ventricosum]
MAALGVADFYRKMAAKISESEGSSDGGGRRGQQQHRCGCSVTSWLQVALQRKIAAGSFLPQGSLLAAIKEDRSKRSLLAALGSERCVLRLKG